MPRMAKRNDMANGNLKALIERQRPGFSLEQVFYLDPDIFARDMERVFARQWLLADHVSRIPEVGDYFLFNIGGESIIILRSGAEEVRAFYNVCRHRGSRICQAPEGHKKVLVCPYHAWSYRLDGSLKAARLMPEGFDAGDYGLHPCHLRLLDGLIFINLAEGAPPDFAAATKDNLRFLRPHGLDRAKIAHKENYPTQANWKLVVENFYECYHCAPSHPEFCSVHGRQKVLAVGAGAASGPPHALAEFGKVLEAWEAKTREMGHETGHFVDEADTPHLGEASRVPIREGFLSETQDGQPAAPLMGDFKAYDGGQTSCAFNPFSDLLMSNDFAVMFRFTPIGPLETDVELTWLVHEDAEEGEDYQLDRLTWLWDVTTKEDAQIIENNQAGVLSSRYRPGPYSGQETATDRFVRWYLNLLA